MSTPLLKTRSGHALLLAGLLASGPAWSSVTFYQQEGFSGRAYTSSSSVANLARYGLNDRASSAVVTGERWEVCEDAAFRGHCVILRAGNYPSLRAMGLNNAVSSVRPLARQARVDDQRYAPPPLVVQDFRRRGQERLYEAPVLTVRAVLGPPEQRCWIEREQLPDRRDNANVPGAIAGAVIGGLLGHQVGRGDVRDIATVGGAVAGAAIGSQIDGRPGPTRAVEHCRQVPSDAAPAWWDVTYRFRGVDHAVQMNTPPGRSVTVNWNGEPRA